MKLKAGNTKVAKGKENKLVHSYLFLKKD